jgi:two-component system NtrC family sensor kinase
MSLLVQKNTQEKMWIEIIQRMEEMYAELVARHNEIEKKNKELEAAYEELRKIQNQLIQSEKMRSLGRMAAGVAHEINNPLGGILIYGHLLLEDTDDSDPRQTNIMKIVTEAEKCRNIVKDLLGFARPAVADGEPVNLKVVLENTISLLDGQAIFHNIDIEFESEEVIPGIKGDASQLQQAFTNVILNAVQAMERKGKLTIKLHRQNGNQIIVSISDTGHGISPEHMKKIFEPFFTTKQAGQGTGLGLAITYSIVENHGGKIEVKSEVGKGSTFRIIFPVRNK